MKKIEWKELIIKPHQIVTAYTSEPDYEMSRIILLKQDYNTFVIVEGYHCSCYDFDETEWDAIQYTEEELKKIAWADYNQDSKFWEEVRNSFY
jgi:hypothetical protein